MSKLISRRLSLLNIFLFSIYPFPIVADKKIEKKGLFPQSIGDKNSKINVKEYISLTCGHCANFHKNTFPLIKKEFIDKNLMNFHFIDYPLDKLAMIAATLLRSIPNESYFAALDILLKNQKIWVNSKNQLSELYKISKTFGVSKNEFEYIIKNTDLMQKIIDKMEIDNKKFDIQSTPTFILNNKYKISGYLSFDEFKNKLNEFKQL